MRFVSENTPALMYFFIRTLLNVRRFLVKEGRCVTEDVHATSRLATAGVVLTTSRDQGDNLSLTEAGKTGEQNITFPVMESMIHASTCASSCAYGNSHLRYHPLRSETRVLLVPPQTEMVFAVFKMHGAFKGSVRLI